MKAGKGISKNTGKDRTNPGVVYTPLALAEKVIRKVLPHLHKPVNEITVLEPSFGEGVFIEAVMNQLGRPKLFIGYETDREAVNKQSGKCPHVQLINENFIECDLKMKFDLIIGNPPWYSFSGRQAQQKHSGVDYEGWGSMHGAFIMKCSAACKENGVLALLLPLSIGYQQGYASLRSYLNKSGSVVLFEPIGEKAFAGVTEPASILVWVKTSINKYTTDSSASWMSASPVNNIEEALLRKLDKYESMEIFTDNGVHTGNAATELIVKRVKDGSCVPIREGKDITPYYADEPNQYLQPDPILPANKYYSIPSFESVKKQAILIRQTADRPIAAVHEKVYYYRNSVLGCKGVQGHSDHYIACLLNSDVLAWMHRKTAWDSKQKSFPQVKISHLKLLPLRTIDSAKHNSVELSEQGCKLALNLIRMIMNKSD